MQRVDRVGRGVPIVAEDRLDELVLQHGALGAADGDALPHQVARHLAERLVAQDSGGLQEQCGDDAGGIKAKLAPRGAHQVRRERDRELGAGEQRGEFPAARVGRKGHQARAALADPVLADPLGGEVDDHRHDSIGGQIRRKARAVLDAVLQDRDRCSVRAEPGKPRRRAGGIVGFRRDQHPVHHGRGGRVGQRGRLCNQEAGGGLDRQAGQRSPGAEKNFMPPGVHEPGGKRSADGAGSDDSDAGHGGRREK